MILIVCGSPRAEGQTNQALHLIEHRLKQLGCETRFVHVWQLHLPTYGLNQEPPTNLSTWLQAVQSASALVFGSPEYHGSFSGGLKNLLDYLDYTHVAGKPTALVAASGSPRGGLSTLSAMRHVLRSLHVPVIVEQLAVCPHDKDPQNNWTPELLKQVNIVAAGLHKQLALEHSRGNGLRCSLPLHT